jgi:polysaccharide biosynthesis protein PslG
VKSTRRGLLLGGLGAAGVAAAPSTWPALAAPVTAGSPVDPSFFGLHDATGLSWSRLSPGSLRLWDVGVTWADIEVSPGHYDFARLNQLLSQFSIDVSGAPQVTYVFGHTPLFYGTQPGPSLADPPPLDQLDTFVRAVVTEMETSHPGKVGYYQVWNEPSDPQFFKGTPAQLVAMTRTIYLAVKAIAPHATVIAPSFPTRLTYQQNWFRDYLTATVAGVHPWTWFDRVGFSMYPPVGSGPEAMLGLLATMKGIMITAGVPAGKQTAHASEINYDVGKTGPTLLPDASQVAFTMRTYLVGAIAEFERMHWYRYDWGYVNGRPLGNTYWTDPVDHSVVTPAGLAFNLVRSWMGGTYTGGHASPTSLCRVSIGNNISILWKPDGSATVPASVYGQRVVRSDGTGAFYQTWQSIPVDYRPIWVMKAFTK